ncbi:hypothetical protein DUI87_02590 [Hirundo rustica rustica]|uniref:Integrase-type domain-containing protein n=1 Tax=Hirundo rustica rustica TaxID=333673 RepID=A0A3M0L9C9_HIRRU|nr:hypothetical protein DUI87_02590 [Hirundo rustica rustica]
MVIWVSLKNHIIWRLNVRLEATRCSQKAGRTIQGACGQRISRRHVKEEGAQEQVLDEMTLADANERCKAAILSLSMEPAPTLHDMLQSPDVIVKDPATRESRSPHDLVTWGRGYDYVSTPPGFKWVPPEWVKPFIPKSAKPPAEAPQVASAAWRRRKRRILS